MRDIEDALRAAMADDVAGVVAQPDLAGRVRARHRHHQRMRLTAALAVVAAIVIVVPMTAAVVRHDAAPPANSVPALDEVDGVRVGYLPDGLRRDPVDGVDFGGGEMTPGGWTGWTARTGRWDSAPTGRADGRDSVRVIVVRAALVNDTATFDRWVYPGKDGMFRALAEYSGEGRVFFRSSVEDDRQWRDVLWRAGDDLVIWVRVSEDLAHEHGRVVDGIEVVGPGDPLVLDAGRHAPPAGGGLCDPVTNLAVASSSPRSSPEWDRFGGVVVGYLPDGLAEGGFSDTVPRSGLAEDGRWQYTYRWRWPGNNTDAMVLTVHCEEEPEDADLRGFLPETGAAGEPERYAVLSPGRAYVIDEGLDAPGGRTVVWAAGQGAAAVLSVSERLVDHVDRIVTSTGFWYPGLTRPLGHGCLGPELDVTALPWLADGERPAFSVTIEPRFGAALDATRVWTADPEAADPFAGLFVALTRVHLPDAEPGERFGLDRQVRGHPAETVWVGDVGNSAVQVSWRERPGLCGVYRLSLNTRDLAPLLGAQWADGGRCAEFQDQEVYQTCYSDLVRAIDDELDRILGSLIEQG